MVPWVAHGPLAGMKQQPRPPESINAETEVLAIARQTVATNYTWVDQAGFEALRRQADGSWSVLVWRLPKLPGRGAQNWGGRTPLNLITSATLLDPNLTRDHSLIVAGGQWERC
jgi:hypothetical protein